MSNLFRLADVTGTNSSFGIFSHNPAPMGKELPKRDVSGAVYSHIRAVRALGITQINTAQIAKALDLPVQDVDRSIGALRSKGVKLVGK